MVLWPVTWRVFAIVPVSLVVAAPVDRSLDEVPVELARVPGWLEEELMLPEALPLAAPLASTEELELSREVEDEVGGTMPGVAIESAVPVALLLGEPLALDELPGWAGFVLALPKSLLDDEAPGDVAVLELAPGCVALDESEVLDCALEDAVVPVPLVVCGLLAPEVCA